MSIIKSSESKKTEREKINEKKYDCLARAEILLAATKPVEVLSTRSPLDILASLQNRLDGIVSMVYGLDLEFEDAAINLKKYIDSNSDDTQKLKQLQAVLRSIGQ